MKKVGSVVQNKNMKDIKKHEGLVRLSMKGIYSNPNQKLSVKVFITGVLAGKILELIALNENHYKVK